MRPSTSMALLLGSVIATAATATLIDRAGQAADQDPRPLASNGDARGVMAARRYLASRGSSVIVTREHSTRRARAAGTMLLVGPSARVLSRAEVDEVMEAVRDGLTLLLFAPDGSMLRAVQPVLAGRLEITSTPRRGTIPGDSIPGRDASEVIVPWETDPIFGGGRRFLARVRRGIAATDFQPIAGTGTTPVIVRRAFGRGQIYLFATPSLIENHRIDLEDNLHLLEGIRSLAPDRPLLIDDEHLLPPERVAAPLLAHPAILGALLQGLMATLLLLLAIGRRFGPIRPLQRDPRRRTLDYVDSLAALLRRSRQVRPLCEATYRQLRHDLWRRYGISTALSLEEAADRFSRRTGLPPEILQETADACLSPEATVAAAVGAVAQLEARLGARTMA